MSYFLLDTSSHLAYAYNYRGREGFELEANQKMAKLVSESGYVDMRAQIYEGNIMADSFNKVCAENQRMRGLLQDCADFFRGSGYMLAALQEIELVLANEEGTPLASREVS